MPKSIFLFYIIVIIYEILFTTIIGRINIDKINFPLVRLFKEFQCGEVIPFDEKIHLAAMVNEEVFFFSQYRSMGIQHLVDFFPMFFKDESVFLSVHIFFQIGEIGKQMACILILRCSGDEGPDSFDLIQQVFSLLLGYIYTHFCLFSHKKAQCRHG